MRSHWETSAKPIYVRTVWNNGVRHAILSKNDPLASGTVPKRPYSCGNILQNEKAKRNKKRSSSNSNDYYRKVSISTTSNESSPVDNFESSSEIEYEYRFDTEQPNEDVDFMDSKIILEDKRQSHFNKFNYKNTKLPDVKTKSEKTSSLRETHRNYNNYFARNNFINPITERVLNWLDLANKETTQKNLRCKGNDEQAESTGKEYCICDENNNDTAVDESTTGNEQCNQMNEPNKAWSRQGNTLQTVQQAKNHYSVSNNQNNYTAYENASALNNQRNRGLIGNINDPRRNNFDSAKQTEAKKLNKDLSEESLETSRHSNTYTKNCTFNLDTTRSTTNVTALKTPVESKNSYSKHVRRNNDIIRRNNENISRLVQNIDEFQRTNEIICHTAHKGMVDNNMDERKTENKIFNESLVNVRNKQFYNNMESINNNKKHSENDKDSHKNHESGTKTRQKKTYRKSRSNRRRCSSRESQESKSQELEGYYENDCDNTIR